MIFLLQWRLYVYIMFYPIKLLTELSIYDFSLTVMNKFQHLTILLNQILWKKNNQNESSKIIFTLFNNSLHFNAFFIKEKITNAIKLFNSLFINTLLHGYVLDFEMYYWYIAICRLERWNEGEKWDLMVALEEEIYPDLCTARYEL